MKNEQWMSKSKKGETVFLKKIGRPNEQLNILQAVARGLRPKLEVIEVKPR